MSLSKHDLMLGVGKSGIANCNMRYVYHFTPNKSANLKKDRLRTRIPSPVIYGLKQSSSYHQQEYFTIQSLRISPQDFLSDNLVRRDDLFSKVSSPPSSSRIL